MNSTGRITGAVAAMAVAGLLAWSTGLVTAQASAPASAVRGAPAAAGVTAPPAFTATPDKTFSAADAHQGWPWTRSSSTR